MSTTSKKMFRGAAALSNETLYSVPTGSTAVVTNILISNVSGTNNTYSLIIGGIPVVSNGTVLSNDVIAIDLRQTLNALDAIEGSASSTDVKFHISGVEITV